MSLGGFALLIFGVCPSKAVATIAIPTDFASMIAKSDVVFAGKVVGKRAEWATRGGKKIIVTVVSFQPTDMYKGFSAAKIELACPGGTIDGKAFEVVGLPQFEVGEACVVFARTNSKAFSPIVGLYHGKLSIKDDAATGQQLLLKHDRSILLDINQIGHDPNDDSLKIGGPPLARAPMSSAVPLTLRQFKEHARNEVQSPSKNK